MTTYSSGNIDTTRTVVQAYLNITQDITQGSISHQLLDINCVKNNDTCNKCIETAKKYGLGNGDYSTICNVCFCTLENVNMNNVITINMDAFLSSTGSDFAQQVQNALVNQVGSGNGFLFNTKGSNGLTALSDSSKDMHQQIQNSSIQKSLQDLKNFQIISIKTPNSSLINVDLDLAVNFISNILQQNTATSSILSNINSTIIQLTTQEQTNSLNVIISWIVTLVVVGLMIVVSLFMVNIVMENLSLYASS